MTETRFSDLELTHEMLAALDDMGYVTPTPVQASAIPMVFTGRDLMVQSQTGTGKTAAFGIPLIERLGERPQGVTALILAPTRELARQVADELGRLGQTKRIQTAAVYGGASLEKQVAEMRFAHIVAGTPGRVLDHLRRKTLRLNNLQVLVLDEADEMLSMGFAQELSMIMDFVPEQRQTLLFSATIPQDVRRYAQRYMREPEFLSLIEENVAADDVEHHYYMVSGVGRPRDLVQVLEYEDPESAIIFANTRKDSELIARYLQRQGYDAEYLNGDLPQREREAIMLRAKEKSLRFLVATDIAARGIDISELSHVVNYVLPESPEVYIHRTGRTGRAGASGTAISLIGPREIGVYYYLKRIYNVALLERTVPTQAEIEMRREERRTDALVDEIRRGTADLEPGAAELRAQTIRLLERDDAVEVVQALLRYFHAGGGRRPGAPVGGVLGDVPKPERLAPGARPQTLQGVADRVAIVQSEFRGLPGKKAPAELPARAAPQTPPPPAEAEPAPPAAAPPAAASVEAVAEAPHREEAVPPAEEEAFGERRPRRRRRRGGESETEAAAPAEEEQPALAPPAAPAQVEEEEVAAAEEGPRRRRRRSTPAPEAEAQAPQPAPAAAAPRSDEPIAEEPLAPDLTRIFVNLGRRDGLEEGVLREAIAELAGLLPEDIRDVQVRGRHSYVIVHRDYAEDLIEAVDGETLDGRAIRVEYAKNDG